jgi:MFS family permease
MAAPVVPVVIGGLLAWRVYRRLRRHIGQQPLRPRRIITSIVIFSVLCVVFFINYAQFTEVLLGLGGGLLLGALLGLLSLRLTKFETTDLGHFYTPKIPTLASRLRHYSSDESSIVFGILIPAPLHRMARRRLKAR